MASAIGSGLEFQGDGRRSGQGVFSFDSNTAAPILTQRLAPAERPFTGTFPPFGRYFQWPKSLESADNDDGIIS
jgi:hypothetical protein